MGSPNRWCSPSLSLSPCPPSTTSALCQTAGWAQRLSASSTSNTSSCLRDIPHILVLYNRLTHTQTNPQRCTEETTLHTSHIHLSLSFFLDKCTHTLSQCCPVDSQSCWTCSRCPSPPWGTRSTRVCTSSPTSIPSRHRSTQIYHTDTNVLLGAPTGSGKTIAAELAMFRVFNQYPTSKVCLPPSLYLSIFLFQYRSTFLSVYPCSVCVLRWCTLPL